MTDLNANTAALMRIINGELRQSNIFVNKVLTTTEVNGWSDKQTLAKMVVILGRENNRLQDKLLKAEYAKAYSPNITIPVLNADNVKPLLEAAYYYGERTGDYGMQEAESDAEIMKLVAGLNNPMTKGVATDQPKQENPDATHWCIAADGTIKQYGILLTGNTSELMEWRDNRWLIPEFEPGTLTRFKDGVD